MHEFDRSSAAPCVCDTNPVLHDLFLKYRHKMAKKTYYSFLRQHNSRQGDSWIDDLSSLSGNSTPLLGRKVAHGAPKRDTRVISLSSLASTPRQISAKFLGGGSSHSSRGFHGLFDYSPLSQEKLEYVDHTRSGPTGINYRWSAVAGLDSPAIDPRLVYKSASLLPSGSTADVAPEQQLSDNDFALAISSWPPFNMSCLGPSRKPSYVYVSLLTELTENPKPTKTPASSKQEKPMEVQDHRHFQRVHLSRRAQRSPVHDESSSDTGSNVSIVKRPKKMTKLSKPKQDFHKTRVNYCGLVLLQFVERSLLLTNTAKALPRLPTTGGTLTRLLDQRECRISRLRYVRETLESLEGLHRYVLYEKNAAFSVAAPYQQEFTRIEYTEDGVQKRSGLCAYCEELTFFELKTSTYAQHMCHSHGIHTTGYLTPEPLSLGWYMVKKAPTTKRRTTNSNVRERQCVVCPVCYVVIEVRCWKTKAETNPFSNYFRHFKLAHHTRLNIQQFFTLQEQ